jgi:hypothetical protein
MDLEKTQEIITIYWTSGSRHNLALGTAALLATAGVSEEAAKALIEDVCMDAGDDETDDRLRCVANTYSKVRKNEPISAKSFLEEVLPQSVIEGLVNALGLRKEYDYPDENGDLLYQVVRTDFGPKIKTFTARHKDSQGNWVYNLADCRVVPYNLPNVIKAVGKGEPIFIMEGEKCAEALIQQGFVATTNPFGAGKWRNDFNKYFQSANVIILPDNDDVGREHARQVAKSLLPVARRVRVVELPGLTGEGADIVDWLAAGHTIEELERIVEETPELHPTNSKENPGSIAVVDVLGVPDPGPIRWIVEGILPEGYNLTLGGRPKMGKTTILFKLLAAIAEGLPFEGHKTYRVKTLALFMEDDAEDVRREMQRYGLKTPGMVLLPDLSKTKGIDWDTAFYTAAENGCKLLVVDPLATITKFAPGKSGYEDLYATLHAIRDRSHQFGISVLATTHVAKGKTVARDLTDVIDALIGSTAYSAAADGVAFFGQHPNDPSLRRMLGQGRKHINFDLTFKWNNGMYQSVSQVETLSAIAQEIYDIMLSSDDGSLWSTRALRDATGHRQEAVEGGLQELKVKGLAVFIKCGNRIKWKALPEIEVNGILVN